MESIYLVEATDSAGTVHRFSSGTGYMSLPTDTPPNAWYEPRIEQPGLFRQNMYDVGTTSGASSGGYGEITMTNTDGGLDGFVDLGFDGQTCLVKVGTPGAALSSFATVISGTIEQCELSWNLITFRLKDNAAYFNTPLQLTLFAGSNISAINYMLHSQGFDQAAWGKFASAGSPPTVTANAVTAPDGTMSADTVTQTSIASALYQASFAMSGAITATQSLFVKSITATVLIFDLVYQGGALQYGGITFNPVTGAFSAPVSYGITGLSYTAEDYANGWWRIILTATGTDPATTSTQLTIYDYTSASSSYAVWQGQVALGSVAHPPILTTDAAGTAYVGIEGGTDIKDKRKPRLFGKCNNITPICVNSDLAKHIYQVNSGAVHSISMVYDDGVELAPGNDHARNEWLQMTAPAAGTYDTCLAEGLFRLGSSPAGQITCDVVQGAAVSDRTAGQIIKILAAEKTGPASIVAQSIIDLDKTAPYTVGLYAGDTDMNTSEALDILCGSVGAWWGFDNLGKFWCKQLTAPDPAQAIMTLTQSEEVSIERTATADGDKGLPVWKVNIDFSKNWTVQTSGLAGSVSGNQLTFTPDNVSQLSTARRNLLAMEYLRTKADDASVKALHLLAPELVIKTTLDSQADADAEAARVLALRKIRRDRLNITLPMQAVQYLSGGNWDDEAISEMPEPRSGHSAVVYGNWLYIIGGYINGATYETPSVIRLDLSNPTGAWDDAGVTDLPTGRRNATAEIFGDWLYVFGGRGASGPLAEVIRLNLTNPTGAWDNAGVTDLPVTRYGHASAIYGNFVYIFGGQTTTSYRLDLSAPGGIWYSTGIKALPAARTYHTAALYGTWLYIIGGLIAGSPTASVIRLDMTAPSGAWDDAGVTDLPTAQHLHTSFILGASLYITGGSAAGFYFTKVIRLDLTNPTGAWDDAGVTDLPVERANHATAVYNGSAYLLGGFTTSDFSNTWRYRTNSNPSDISQLTSLGRTVLVKHPRYGYTAGRAMKIIGCESDYRNRSLLLELWG